MMTDDDDGSVVTVATIAESVVSVVTRVEPAGFRQVEDEVDRKDEVDQEEEVDWEDEVDREEEVDEVVEEEDDHTGDQSGDPLSGKNHPVHKDPSLSNRFYEN